MDKTLNKEEVKFIYEPQHNFKLLEANRLTKDSHVRSLMGAFLRGEWVPPIYVTKDGYIVDGQNRYKAFCNICVKYPSKGTFLRVLTINSDEDPIKIAIYLNSGQRKWMTDDYFHAYVVRNKSSYIKLSKFMSRHKQLQGVKSALQLIKGSYATKVFQSGSLELTDREIDRADLRMDHLNKVYAITKDPRVYSRDIIIAFYVISNEIKSWSVFLHHLKYLFKAPLTQKCTDWYTAYRACMWYKLIWRRKILWK